MGISGSCLALNESSLFFLITKKIFFVSVTHVYLSVWGMSFLFNVYLPSLLRFPSV